MKIDKLTDVVFKLLGDGKEDLLREHESELSAFLSRVPAEVRKIEELCVNKPENFLDAIGAVKRLQLIARIRSELESTTQNIYKEPEAALKLKYDTLIQNAETTKEKLLYCVLAIVENSNHSGEEIFIETRSFNVFQNYFYDTEYENTRSHLRQILQENPHIGKKVSKGFMLNLSEVRKFLGKT